jgi:glucose-1-phosphate thymidylyltransferase
MKGIILAGGTGSRLWPATEVVSKQLLPVYDKPLVYYPLTTLMLAGIRELLLISTPRDLPSFKRLLKNASSWGIDVSFAEQAKPGGLAEALLIGETFIGGDEVALILGDNLFHGSGLGRQLRDAFISPGALIAAYHVSDPTSFGVVEFDRTGVVTSLEEKPKNPRSSWAVPGIYFYDNTAVERAKTLRPSLRNELEITDLNKTYMSDGTLRVQEFSRGTTWLDMGTPNSLLEASEYVKTIQHRQGLVIGSPEEAAWRAGWISDDELITLMQPFLNTDYGKLLSNLKLDR